MPTSKSRDTKIGRLSKIRPALLGRLCRRVDLKTRNCERYCIRCRHFSNCLFSTFFQNPARISSTFVRNSLLTRFAQSSKMRTVTKVFDTRLAYRPFLVFDFLALWRSGLSVMDADEPPWKIWRQKAKTKNSRLASLASNPWINVPIFYFGNSELKWVKEIPSLLPPSLEGYKRDTTLLSSISDKTSAKMSYRKQCW